MSSPASVPWPHSGPSALLPWTHCIGLVVGGNFIPSQPSHISTCNQLPLPLIHPVTDRGHFLPYDLEPGERSDFLWLMERSRSNLEPDSECQSQEALPCMAGPLPLFQECAQASLPATGAGCMGEEWHFLTLLLPGSPGQSRAPCRPEGK